MVGILLVIGICVIGILVNIPHWLGSHIQMERTRIAMGFYGDKPVNIPATVIKRMLFDFTVAAIFAFCLKWIFSVLLFVAVSGTITNEWGVTLIFFGIMLILISIIEKSRGMTNKKNNYRTYLLDVVHVDALKLAGIQELDSFEMEWADPEAVPVEKIKEINQLYLLHEQLSEKESKAKSVLYIGKPYFDLMENVERKKKEITGQLKTSFVELKKIERAVKEKPNREKLIHEVQAFLDISVIDESERIDIRELKEIMESKTLPESIKRQASKTIQEILEKDNAQANRKQRKLNEAEHVIQIAKMMNNIKD